MAPEADVDRTARDAEVSVVARGTRIEGKVTAAGSLRVEGQVKGAVTAKGDVWLSPESRVQATIRARGVTLAGQIRGDVTADGDVSLPPDSRLDGDVRARNVSVGGEVAGDILAEGKVELGDRARVQGNISSETLVVSEGAVFTGRSIMGEERSQASAPVPAAAPTGRPGAQQPSRKPPG